MFGKKSIGRLASFCLVVIFIVLPTEVLLKEVHQLPAREITEHTEQRQSLEDLFPAWPPYLFDPTGPNATCVDRSTIDFSEFPECAQIEYDYDSIYIDDLQFLRIEHLRFLATTIRISPLDCAVPGFSLACMTTWRACQESTDELPVLAHSPCRDVCEGWSDSCVEYAVANGREFFRPFFNCSEPHPSAWGPSNYTIFPYPNDTTYNLSITDPVLYSDVMVDLSCKDVNDAEFTIECPGGLVPDGDFCGLGCPLAILNDSDYEALKVTISVLSWISFICCLVLTILWLSPVKRKFPNILPLWFIICVGMSSFALTFGSFVGYEELWCKNKAEPNDFGDAACTIQGILWVYFTLAGVLWWLVIAINMFLNVVLPESPFMKKYGAYIYHFLWFLPLLPLIIGLANQRIGYGGDVWCTVHLTDPSVEFVASLDGVQARAHDGVFFWKLGLLMLPICIVVALGMTLIVAMLIILVIKGNLTLRYFLEQWRLSIFFIFYFWVYIFLFIFWTVVESSINEQLDAYEKYLNCLFLQNSFFAVSDSCSLDREVSFPLWYIACFIVSTQGIVVFLLFGTSTELWKGWGSVFSKASSILQSNQSIEDTKMSTTNSGGDLIE